MCGQAFRCREIWSCVNHVSMTLLSWLMLGSLANTDLVFNNAV